MKKTLVVGVLCFVLGTAGTAWAVPAVNAPPADTFMLDGQVRGMGRVGANMWLGGRFTSVLNANGQFAYAASNLAVFTVEGVGTDIAPDVDGTVWDLWVHGSTVYIGGTFTTVDGQPRQNLAAIDGATGALLPFSVRAPKLRTVAATDSIVYAGGVTLRAYRLDGSRLPGWISPKAVIDYSIRTHDNSPIFRDLHPSPEAFVAACQCDAMVRAGVTKPTKAVVRINAATGAIGNWGPTELPATSAAMGRAVHVKDGSVFAAIGGSDFVARYSLSTGDPEWKIDTNGSAQALTFFGGDLIVGGHFRWVEGARTGGSCSKGTDCVYQPKLVALDPATGALAYHIERTSVGPRRLANWDPAFCCEYNGVWRVMGDGQGDLWVGGQFTRVGTAWDPQRMLQGLVPRALQSVQQQYVAELG